MNLQNLLNKYKINVDIKMVLDMWNESHRHYHNLDHLNDLLQQINENYGEGKFDERFRDKLMLTALFHDIVYEPSRQDNEERSAQFFEDLCVDKSSQELLEVKKAILDTKSHNSDSKLSETFNKYDMNIVERDFDSLLRWESGIYEEFKSFGDQYKTGRLQFLESLLDKYPQNSDNLLKLIDWVKTNY
jgi:predicted metal-dependent HD superfamily phosphohydrolase